jgi:hypothetical protein
VNTCVHGMGRADWCAICTPRPKPERTKAPRPKLGRPKVTFKPEKVKPLISGTKEGQPRKLKTARPVSAEGKAAPQEVIVFQRSVRVVEKVRTITKVRRIVVEKEVVKNDFTPLWMAVQAEKAARPYLSVRQLAKIFGVSKSAVARIVKKTA